MTFILPPLNVTIGNYRMNRIVVIAAIGVFWAYSATAAGLPADVRAFMERRDGCDHFRGEEPYDPAREAEIAAKATKLCTGTDAELARLKRIYAHNPAVKHALAGYESSIE